MSQPFDLSKAQDSAERMALTQAHYYTTLVRSGVPPEQAVQLAMHYIATVLQFGAQLNRLQKPGGEK
jgi:hypothetical protein